jgi:ADP-ribose pyrophosphatase YjhB (NUDIX family)
MKTYPFNIRVYGIVTDEEEMLLITDEIIHGNRITKFPGGGLEFGEGTIECLKREFREETGCVVEVGEHFYTTDFFQRSAYNPNTQVISIYYWVKPLSPLELDDKAADNVNNGVEGSILFRKVRLATLKEDEFTFPIDRKVAELLRQKYGNQYEKR